MLLGPLQKKREDSSDDFQSVLFDSSSHADDAMAFTDIKSSPRKQRRQPTAQISHLSAETTCKRIQAEKDHERDLITRLYQRRARVYQQMDEVRIHVLLGNTRGPNGRGYA